MIRLGLEGFKNMAVFWGGFFVLIFFLQSLFHFRSFRELYPRFTQHEHSIANGFYPRQGGRLCVFFSFSLLMVVGV